MPADWHDWMLLPPSAAAHLVTFLTAQPANPASNTTTTTILVGRLLNSAGVRNCAVSSSIAVKKKLNREKVDGLLTVPSAAWPWRKAGFITKLLQKACLHNNRLAYTLVLLQGTYAVLPSQNVLHNMTTNVGGSFSVAEPAAAAYTFKNSYPGSKCVDSLTGRLSAGNGLRSSGTKHSSL
jgi:hypothetical protein